MSKLYEKYLKLKEKDNSKLYLFKNGKFYIFLDEDTNYINEYMVLKKTEFCKGVYKCGFPEQSLEAYLKVFNNHKLNIEIVDSNIDKTNENNIYDYLNKIDINTITPLEALTILKELKEYKNEK